jgi:asparagine synthase (glutamine-hydrolysing)
LAVCGIAGIVDLNGRAVDAGLLGRLCERLAHRGPDAQGVHVDRGVGLGQRRLSIIDLAGGRQPMANEDATVWLTFNGEVYNFQQLRPGLEARGHRFATRSDTEVVLHAYEEYGAGCVRRFRGMFAFAVWDARARTLFLARDRVGKKPLFYTRAGGQFVFASELRSLLEHPAVSREPDPAALDDYLTYGYVPAPKTAYRGVYKLPPAHTLTLTFGHDGSAGEPRVEPYWALGYGPKLDVDETEAGERLLEILTEAVRLRMIADVPLGALLSGGIDSGVVVALMSRLSDRPVKTFSIGFEQKAYDELPYARLVARRYGTEHHELVVRPAALEVLPTLVRHYGEPFADSSAVPSYYVSQMTRQHVTVALNGDGGDESFAGYERYYASGLAEGYWRIPVALRAGVIEPLAALIPGSLPGRNRLSRAKRFVEVAGQPAGRRYLRWVSYFSPPQRRDLYAAGFRAAVDGHDADAWLLARYDAAAAAGLGRLDALLATDVASYLPYDLLVKVDIATMAHGLEARSPLLDHVLMEFAAALPAGLKLRGRTSKYLLRKVARGLLPAANLRRRKMGFGVPVGDWMRGELRPLLEDALLSPRARARGYFRPESLRQLVGEHVGRVRDHTYRLWALLWLELWHREFLD